MCDVVEVRSVKVCGRTSQIEEDSDFEGKKIVKKKKTLEKISFHLYTVEKFIF